MYWKTLDFLTWVQNEGLSVNFKFWAQGKNELIILQYFFNFLSIFSAARIIPLLWLCFALTELVDSIHVLWQYLYVGLFRALELGYSVL